MEPMKQIPFVVAAVFEAAGPTTLIPVSTWTSGTLRVTARDILVPSLKFFVGVRLLHTGTHAFAFLRLNSFMILIRPRVLQAELVATPVSLARVPVTRVTCPHSFVTMGIEKHPALEEFESARNESFRTLHPIPIPLALFLLVNTSMATLATFPLLIL